MLYNIGPLLHCWQCCWQLEHLGLDRPMHKMHSLLFFCLQFLLHFLCHLICERIGGSFFCFFHDANWNVTYDGVVVVSRCFGAMISCGKNDWKRITELTLSSVHIKGQNIYMTTISLTHNHSNPTGWLTKSLAAFTKTFVQSTSMVDLRMCKSFVFLLFFCLSFILSLGVCVCVCIVAVVFSTFNRIFWILSAAIHIHTIKICFLYQFQCKIYFKKNSKWSSERARDREKSKKRRR